MNEAEPGRAREQLASEEHPLFVRVYRENQAGLTSFVRRRVTGEAEAADIVQEAYLGLLRYRDQQNPAALRALLFRIALNIIGMRLRTARTHHPSRARPDR